MDLVVGDRHRVRIVAAFTTQDDTGCFVARVACSCTYVVDRVARDADVAFEAGEDAGGKNLRDSVAGDLRVLVEILAVFIHAALEQLTDTKCHDAVAEAADLVALEDVA